MLNLTHHENLLNILYINDILIINILIFLGLLCRGDWITSIGWNAGWEYILLLLFSERFGFIVEIELLKVSFINGCVWGWIGGCDCSGGWFGCFSEAKSILIILGDFDL